MAEINWNALAVPDIGGTFMNAFQKGAEMKRQHETRNALSTLVQNPNDQAAFGALAKQDPGAAMQFRSQQQADALKLDEVQAGKIKQRVELVGQAAQWADTPEKWDAAIDYLSTQYPDLAQYKGKFTPEARMAAISASGEMKAYLDRQQPVNLGPGSRLVDPTSGRVIASAPFAPRPVTVGEGQTVVEYAPGSSGPVSVQSLLPAIVAQESGGNYAAVNKSTGAMGAYQVMPATGQSLAQRLGLPWRPDLMTADTPEARQYQDQIGQAAVQEAVDNSGGDVATAASYYHGGSDRSKWGPKTQQYAGEVAARLGQGGSRVIAVGQPKKDKAKDAPSGYRWKADGTMEPIPGGPADKSTPKDPGYSQSAMDAFNRAIDSANRLLEHPGLQSAVGVKGLTGGLLGGWVVPGTDAADFGAELDAMKAQVFLPMVQSMKGMGALSNAEGEKLTASIGALNPKMSEAAFKASLNRIITDLKTYRERGAQPAPQQAAPRGGGPVRISSDAEYAKLKSGAVFIGPDGKTRRKP